MEGDDDAEGPVLDVDGFVDNAGVDGPKPEVVVDVEYPAAPASRLEVAEDTDGATAELWLAA